MAATDTRSTSRRERTPGANDLSIYSSFANTWWDGNTRWLRTLHNMVPARMRYFERFVGTWQGRDVLDLGCGGGFMSEALAKCGARVVGVDPSAEAIAAAREHAARGELTIDYRVGVGETLDAADSTFDAVVCVDVLEHVDDLQAVLDTVGRVLKPGGWFCFDTINRNPAATAVVIWGAERVLRLLPRGTHDPKMFIKPAELEEALSRRGFTDIACAGLGPTGLDRKLDFTFGRTPVTMIQYMGVARKSD